VAVADETAAQSALWWRIWLDKKLEVAGRAAMLAVLTRVFFFQGWATRNERAFFWFRMGFLTVTLVFLGWYANAQLSVVNVMALFGALMSGFSGQAFLLDPLTFILWFAVAAALLFWGRAAYCGWLCPFWRSAGDPRAAEDVRLAEAVPRLRQPLPDLRASVPGAGDPPHGRDQPQ
jgi:NosR/NirI family nitrous oxide reductase transcriptional regulator